jgi:hypothetical protein
MKVDSDASGHKEEVMRRKRGESFAIPAFVMMSPLFTPLWQGVGEGRR